MITNQLTDTRVELLSAAAVVSADGSIKNTGLTLFVGGSAVRLPNQGLCRFDAEPPRLRVFAGKAVIERRGREAAVGSGRTIALETGVRAAEKFDTRNVDAFDLWSKRRVEALAGRSGLADRQARQRLENEAGARQATAQEAQVRDPRSIYYDPVAPAPQMRSIGPSGTPSGTHWCAGSGR